MIASASSLAAALVVSKLWGGGTLIGAAMTPVIVTLVSEGLRRPATVITTVRETRAGRYDPVAEGRAGLREGDLDAARPSAPVPATASASASAERRVHRTTGRASGGGRRRLRLTRPRVIAAVVTGLVGFLLAGVFLTGSELVLGKSVVSASKRTTYIPVHRSTSSATTRTKTTDTTDTTTTPETTTTTTPTTSTPTTTEPPATSTTPTAPPTQTAPPATTTPPAAAPPATPTTPAPQSATPPASTTP
jgi:cytoskeletal protein RodZ